MGLTREARQDGAKLATSVAAASTAATPSNIYGSRAGLSKGIGCTSGPAANAITPPAAVPINDTARARRSTSAEGREG